MRRVSNHEAPGRVWAYAIAPAKGPAFLLPVWTARTILTGRALSAHDAALLQADQPKTQDGGGGQRSTGPIGPSGAPVCWTSSGAG